MKIVKKSRMHNNAKCTQYIKTEKQILKTLKNPFVVKLFYSFQEDYCIYFVLEYIRGVELFQLIRKLKKLEEKVARYLFAEILIGMRYLHETINVMYRDLKPENIMIDREGHAKIIDVGLAC